VSIHMEGYSHASEFVLFQPEFIHSKTPIILVPTSAGTGSEVTGVAVISIPAKNGKWSVFTNTDLAIVDPELTVTLPASVTVNTALDALSHAMEAMTSVNRCEHSDVFALAAIERINNYLRIAVMEPGNLEARTQLSLAANFAGFAFANPITHVGHSVADALSVTFHSPHGYNCALALPETMRLVAPAMPEQAASIAKALGISVKGLSPEELGEKIADSIRALMRDVNLKSLKEWGKTLEEITALADEVAENHLSDFSPVKITHEVA